MAGIEVCIEGYARPVRYVEGEHEGAVKLLW